MRISAKPICVDVRLDEALVEDFGLLFEVLGDDGDGERVFLVGALDDVPLFVATTADRDAVDRALAEAREAVVFLDPKLVLGDVQLAGHLAQDLFLVAEVDAHDPSLHLPLGLGKDATL